MPFADELLGRPAALALVEIARAARDDRPLPRLRAAADLLGPLALRQRSDLLRDALLDDLGPGYEPVAALVCRMLTSPALDGWMVWPVGTAVSVRAVEDGSPAALDDALDLMAALTPRLSSEFAIRPLLRHDLVRALAAAMRWTRAPDPAVRRLASEGTRPYLPWAIRVPAVITDPTLTLPLLDALHRDPDEVVRRSVANHLNDVSRHAPALVVETAGRWLARPDADGTTRRTVRHALRTLVKRGDAGALALLGFAASEELEVLGPTLDVATVPAGGSLTITASVHNVGTAPVAVAVDYLVHHRKADGSLRPKVFKLTTATVAPGEPLHLRRTHSFRPITTRRYHPGEHAVELQVNGRAHGRTSFRLDG